MAYILVGCAIIVIIALLTARKNQPPGSASVSYRPIIVESIHDQIVRLIISTNETNIENGLNTIKSLTKSGDLSGICAARAAIGILSGLSDFELYQPGEIEARSEYFDTREEIIDLARRTALLVAPGESQRLISAFKQFTDQQAFADLVHDVRRHGGVSEARALVLLNIEMWCYIQLTRRHSKAVNYGRRSKNPARLTPGADGPVLVDSALRADFEEAQRLNNHSIELGERGQLELAAEVAKESVQLFRRLAASDRRAFLHQLAVGVINLGARLSEAGRREEALEAAREAVELCRNLVKTDRQAFLHYFAGSLSNLGNMLGKAGRSAEALKAAQEAVELCRELVAIDRSAHLPALATTLNNLGSRLGEANRRAEALVAALEAVTLRKELVAVDRAAFVKDLASGLNNLGIRLGDLGHRAEALERTREAVDLFRELVLADRQAFLSGLAGGLNNLSARLIVAGRPAEALVAAQESADLRRELVASNREAFLTPLAETLGNLGTLLGRMGRHAEALATVQEAVEINRELIETDRLAFLPGLAKNLNSLACWLGEVGHHAMALDAVQEAVSLYRELIETDRLAFLPDLASTLDTLGVRLGEVDRLAEALWAAQDAAEMRRELVANNREVFVHELAASLSNLGGRLNELGRNADALASAQEATGLYRELVATDRQAFLPGLAGSLNNLGFVLDDLGHPAEARQVWRECGTLGLEMAPSDPHTWIKIVGPPAKYLDAPQDLRDFHLRLIGQLTECRELAWDFEHATVFLEFQGRVASRVWELLQTLPATEGDLLDQAATAMICTLQSPDLARWLEAQGAQDGWMAELSRVKSEILEAEQLLAALRRGSGPGSADQTGGRSSTALNETPESRLANRSLIKDQAEKARGLREVFRVERQRLIDADPRFASAFAQPPAQTLRREFSHAQGGALLGLMQLPTKDRPRTVGVLLRANGLSTRLLEFPELHDLAWQAGLHVPMVRPGRDRGPMRGPKTLEQSTPIATTSALSLIDEFQAQMSPYFWRPLQEALDQSADLGSRIERIHVCMHGMTQQLPLGLRGNGDLPGVHVVVWPGLPYLRLAAATASRDFASPAQPSPWLVAHDCAWNTEAPLPMVAVEAALLRQLLQDHQQPVQSINQAAQVHGHAAAVVACCHGRREQVQFASALHLGTSPLSVRQIVKDHLGPPLALLPACHAGETVDDYAGNALGVAAGFLLGGSRVVAASSKAVPDMLMPWLSTLIVWHVVHGLPSHEAAQTASRQFASMNFPDDYRAWLKDALPSALATIQPGGEEDRKVRGPGPTARMAEALKKLVRCWPWHGEVENLVSVDPKARKTSTDSVAAGVLLPRHDDAIGLAKSLREMAAFVFVYGADTAKH